MRKRGEPVFELTPQRLRRLASMRREGLTREDMARSFGVSPSTLRAALEKLESGKEQAG